MKTFLTFLIIKPHATKIKQTISLASACWTQLSSAFKRHKTAIKSSSVIYFFTITLIIQPFYPLLADEITISGHEGQQVGQQLLQQFSLPKVLSSDTGLFEIEIQGNTIQLSDSSLFPDTDETFEIQDLKNIYGSDEAFYEFGEAQKKALNQQSTETAKAYQLLNDIHQKSRPDLNNDPIWHLSDEVFNDPNILSQSFEDCDDELEGSTLFRQCDRLNVNLQQCYIKHDYEAKLIEHIKGPLNLDSCGEGCLTVWIGEIGDNYWQGDCNIFEEEISIIVNNPNAITSAVLAYVKWDDYIQVWMDDEKVWSGPNEDFPPETAGVCELKTDFEMSPNTDLTDKFKQLEEGQIATFKIRVSVTGEGEGYAKINIYFDPTQILMTDNWYPNSCLAQAAFFQTNQIDANIQCLDMPNQSAGCSVINGHLVCENHFLPSPIKGISPMCRLAHVGIDHQLLGTNGLSLCQTLEDDSQCGFYHSICIKKDEQNKCIQFQDTYACHLKRFDNRCTVSNLFPSMFEDCHVTENITYFENERHIPDLQICEVLYSLNEDTQQSHTQPNSNLKTVQYNSCQTYQSRSDCHLVESACLSDNNATQFIKQNLATCLNEQLIYDCGVTIPVNNAAVEKSYQCDGPVRCLGHDCLKPNSIEQANFTETLAHLNLMQHMKNDLSCTGQDQSMNVGCEIFKGEATSCKKSIGNIVNCCDTPTGISLSEYITLLSTINHLDSVITSMDPKSATYGAWHTLKSPFSDAMSSMSQPFSSTWDALIGTTTENIGEAGAETLANNFIQTLTNQTAEWVGEVFGAGAQSSLFTNVGGVTGAEGALIGGDFALSSVIGTALSAVMTAYMVYSVTLILIKLLWQCEQNEFELGTKKALKSCHFVGAYCEKNVLGVCMEKRESYCCYASPLARIFQEQIHLQLKQDFGTAQIPYCGGLAVDNMNKIDFQALNLDEWIGILGLTGQLDDLQNINLDNLTGQTNIIEGQDTNIKERLLNKLN